MSTKLLKFRDSQCKAYTGCWSFWNQRQSCACYNRSCDHHAQAYVDCWRGGSKNQWKNQWKGYCLFCAFALFVYSKPCTNFVLLISFTLFTHTRATLKLLKSWTNSSTRESGHHQTKPLWKEIGLNGDNSPKQAVGTMRENCRTEVSQLENNFALFVYSIPCANFVLLISFTLFTHTRTTLKLFDKWVEHHQTKLLWTEMGVNEDNSPKQAVGTMRKSGQHAHFLQEFWLTYCTFS